MPKATKQYRCKKCSRVFAKSFGRCPNCDEYGSFVEESIQPVAAPVNARTAFLPADLRDNPPVSLNEIDAVDYPRIDSGYAEVNRVLGGGFVPGSLILFAGEPGFGKSTLAGQIANFIALEEDVLYASGEESLQQIKMNMDRMGINADHLYIQTETNLEIILAQAEKIRPALLVVDSIQMVYTSDAESSPGSVTQVRECTARLQLLAKSSGITVLIIGHVTKDGNIAGPKILEHLVDTVLYLEGDAFQSFRLLRGVKNRFGSTNEVGVFEMGEDGLSEVPNPSEVFLADRNPDSHGSSIVVMMEGTRPLLVEIQALVSKSAYGSPMRTNIGMDMNQIRTVTAVLTKHTKVDLSDHDVLVKVIGGMKIDEPASDLALAAALISSFYEVPFPQNSAIFGEIALSGDVRRVSRVQQRINEAEKIGLQKVYAPPLSGGVVEADFDIEIQIIHTIRDLADIIAPRSSNQSRKRADKHMVIP